MRLRVAVVRMRFRTRLRMAVMRDRLQFLDQKHADWHSNLAPLVTLLVSVSLVES